MSTIGVRCAAARTTLWFYLEEGHQLSAKALYSPFYTKVEDEAFHELLGTHQLWAELYAFGASIVSKVMAIPGVKAVSVRPDYFSVDVSNEADWRTILPLVIQVIRNETQDLQAGVVVEPSVTAGVEHWHADLLQELFG